MSSKKQPPNQISSLLANHYARVLAKHGATPKGVDWGENITDYQIRLDRMLAVLERGDAGEQPSILDVGCGYGGLLDLIKERQLSVKYAGIDICAGMIEVAKARHPDVQWFLGDILSLRLRQKFDYVVCNGILTQKLSASIRDMNFFLRALIFKMFKLCRIGIAFNVMTTHVNYMKPNLYYHNPVELLGWCMSEITSKVMLDHAYPLFEYTVYLYKEDAPGIIYGAHRK